MAKIKSLPVNRAAVLKEVEALINYGRSNLIKWDYFQRSDIDRDFCYMSAGIRRSVFNGNRYTPQTPTEALTEILENDLAKNLAYWCISDNYQHFKDRDIYPTEWGLDVG